MLFITSYLTIHNNIYHHLPFHTMMKISSPSHPTGTANNFFHGFSPPSDSRRGFDQSSRAVTPQLPEIVEEGGGKVYVAVGKSVDKGVALLQWSFRMFANHEVCILHVHQPSSLIPTLLGKLPASQANPLVVSTFRNQERETTGKLLQKYASICFRAKIKASFITTEADQVQKGIVDLVKKHFITKLVIGATPDMKVKKSSRKASYAAKHAPFFCELWFVTKGKLVWTRHSSKSSNFSELVSQVEPPSWSNLRCRSLQTSKGEAIFHPECLRSSSSRSLVHSARKSLLQAGNSPREVGASPAEQTLEKGCSVQLSVSSPTDFSSVPAYASSAENRVSFDYSQKVEEEGLSDQLAKIIVVAEDSRNEATTELLNCKNLEAEAMEAINKAKTFESAHAREIKLREDAEDALNATIREQEKLVEEREEMTRKLQKAMRNIALLDSRAQEANRRCEEVAGELKLIQATIATLRLEEQSIQRQKMEAVRWIDHWKVHGQAGGKQANGIIIGGSTELVEFSLSDLQTATCYFSESFRIGHGGFGAVYKGELLDMTVAIKKMHPHNIHGLSDFYQQVEVLGKVRHRHLVNLIGISPEAWSLVYEYVPGGNLQDHLFHRSSIYSLNWKTRARIISEIASALSVLHNYPEKIVHSNLKPENILLDSGNSCKVSDFGIYRLVAEQTLRCSSFRRYNEPKGAFPYTDPEYHRTGIVTPKSDIYSFGLIILQLLTGRPPVGLAYEVRRAVSCRNLASILDPSAGEWPTFVARRLVELGLQCCELNSRDRPELTPILLRELKQLHVLEEKPVPPSFLCPILQEVMHDPQVAADGFTYEGEALRGWLENGRDTSPMTNLKLSHLDLTPNHALRLAIQDWLCKS